MEHLSHIRSHNLILLATITVSIVLINITFPRQSYQRNSIKSANKVIPLLKHLQNTIILNNVFFFPISYQDKNAARTNYLTISHAILILSIPRGMRSINAVKSISESRVLHVHLQIQVVIAESAC